ncbi:hypothetical protein [Thermoflexus hugenholtzii]
MRKLVLAAVAGIIGLLFICGGGLAVYLFLRRASGEAVAVAGGTRKARATDGSEIVYPSGYEALDVQNPESFLERARKSIPEPARSLILSFYDWSVFAAIQGDRVLLVAGRDAILDEVPEPEREKWRTEQEQLYRQSLELTAGALRASGAELVLYELSWSERKGAMDVLEIRFSVRQGRKAQPAWMAILYFPRRVYHVLGVGDEKAFRLLLGSSRFAPELEKAARASSTPTAARRTTPTSPRRATTAPTPAPTSVTPFAFPPGWKVLTPEEIRRLMSPESVPPEVRPYVEIVRQGAQAIAYDPKSPGSLIVVARQNGAMTREQADLIRQNWKSVSEMLAEPMRSFMEDVGWTDVQMEPPELFDHRPSRGRAALLAVRFQGSGAYMEVHREFRSVILYFEDATWVVTAMEVDWKTLELVLENSRG